MIIIKDLKTQNYKDIAVALGNFDGVHIAHQEIIKTCVNYAKNEDIKSAVMTFDPHPRKVMRPSLQHKNLTTIEQRIELFKSLGVDLVFLIDFTTEFANISANDFITKILVDNLRVKHIATGYNFLFGRNREGTPELLSKYAKDYNFSYNLINKINYNYHDVSSSNIKEMLGLGAMGIVNRMLGRKYTISGKVIKGNKRARELGVPTANIRLEENLIYPLYGVYLVMVKFDNKEMHGIANIGVRPTFSETNPVLEVHIFNFNGDIYDKDLEVSFLHFIRPERKFGNIDDLKLQIASDVQGAKYALKNL